MHKGYHPQDIRAELLMACSILCFQPFFACIVEHGAQPTPQGTRCRKRFVDHQPGDHLAGIGSGNARFGRVYHKVFIFDDALGCREQGGDSFALVA